MQCIRQKYACIIMSIYLMICWSTYVDLWLINHICIVSDIPGFWIIVSNMLNVLSCIIHDTFTARFIHDQSYIGTWNETRQNGGCWKKCHIQASATCHPPEREHRAGSNRPCWPLHEAIVNWFIGLSFCCSHKLFGCFKFMRKIASASMYW